MAGEIQATPEQKVQQFMHLLPVSLAIAGLATADHGKYMSDEQMEMRARALKTAFKHAKLLLREIAQPEAAQ